MTDPSYNPNDFPDDLMSGEEMMDTEDYGEEMHVCTHCNGTGSSWDGLGECKHCAGEGYIE